MSIHLTPPGAQPQRYVALPRDQAVLLSHRQQTVTGVRMGPEVEMHLSVALADTVGRALIVLDQLEPSLLTSALAGMPFDRDDVLAVGMELAAAAQRAVRAEETATAAALTLVPDAATDPEPHGFEQDTAGLEKPRDPHADDVWRHNNDGTPW